jgi:hypothetical protein
MSTSFLRLQSDSSNVYSLLVGFKLVFLHLCSYYNLVNYVGESVYAEVLQGIHLGPRLRSWQTDESHVPQIYMTTASAKGNLVLSNRKSIYSVVSKGLSRPYSDHREMWMHREFLVLRCAIPVVCLNYKVR